MSFSPFKTGIIKETRGSFTIFSRQAFYQRIVLL
jgi:hypothetical protein